MDPENRIIDLFDQQLDLTDPTDVGPRDDLPCPSIGRKTMERLQSVTALAGHRQTTWLAKDVERENSAGTKDVVLCDAALVVERVRVTHTLFYQAIFVAGRNPGFGFKVLVERP